MIFSRRKIQAGSFDLQDVLPMIGVWNQSFPNHPTSRDRFERFIVPAIVSGDSRCIVAKKSGQVFGWALLEERHGVRIHAMAIGPAGWREQVDCLLFQEILRRYAQRQSVFSIGYVPMTDLSLRSATLNGFGPARQLDEMVMTRSSFRPFASPVADVAIRDYQPDDALLLKKFIDDNDIDPYERMPYDQGIAQKAPLTGSLIAWVNGSIVGVGRAVTEEQVRNFLDLGWLWVAAHYARRICYLFDLMVDRRHRGRGIGTQLMQTRIERMFDSGVGEIYLLTSRSKFHRSIGFIRKSTHFIARRRGGQ